MFTVEMIEEETIITSIDDSGEYEDVILCLDEEGVTIKQNLFIEDLDFNIVIDMSHKQLEDILAAINKPIGAYYHYKEVKK